MNILFLLKSLNFGGLEIVSSTLANKFVSQGHKVFIFIFFPPKDSIENRLSNTITIYSQDEYSYSEYNIKSLRKVLIDNKIDIIINQWGLPYIPAYVAKKASKGLNVKIISVYHNDPSANGKLYDCDIPINKTNNKIKKIILLWKKSIIRFITSRSMRYVYNHSDVYQVLSPSFVERFKNFTGIKNPKKLMVQTNPVTIETGDFVFNPDNKEKEIIYVGRLDSIQKRVYRVIDTWALLEKKYPDWRLTIVGDGVERENIEKQAKALGLKNVSFEGFKSPIEYYKRARILMLTSEYEGFPLVLAECMSFGVVPAVYGSYSAVYDIVNDGVNGIVFPYQKEGFSAEKAAIQLQKIMHNDAVYNDMAEKAIETSKRYSVDEIYKSWEETFEKLKM